MTTTAGYRPLPPYLKSRSLSSVNRGPSVQAATAAACGVTSPSANRGKPPRAMCLQVPFFRLLTGARVSGSVESLTRS